MKFLGQVIATIILLTLAFGNLCLVQYLSWHGPQWMMYTGGNGSYTMLSLLISGPMCILSLFLLIILVFGVWEVK